MLKNAARCWEMRNTWARNVARQIIATILVLTCSTPAIADSTSLDQYANAPSFEDKLAVTESIIDPEQKVSISMIKSIFEDYKRTIFAPYKQEVIDYGCTDEARTDFCAKVLYAYENSGDNLGYFAGDGFQEHVTRDQILDFAKTGKGLEVLYNDEGKPRMLMVNSTKRITKSVKASFDWYKKIGRRNIQDVIYENGAVVYYCSNRGRGAGSFIINEFGLICSEMTDSNTRKIKDKYLMRIHSADLYVESLGILSFQMRSAFGISDYGDYVGDIEVIKSKQVAFVYSELYEIIRDTLFRDNSVSFMLMAKDFADEYSIPISDPRIDRQIAMASVLSTPLEGVSWDCILEIKKMMDAHLSA